MENRGNWGMCIDANSYEDFSVGLVGSIVGQGVDGDCRFGERNL